MRFVRVRLDSKGRISIPAFLRRNLCLEQNSEVVLGFNLKYNAVILIASGPNGQGSIKASTEGCGPSSEGSKDGRLEAIEQSCLAGSPSPDPNINPNRSDSGGGLGGGFAAYAEERKRFGLGLEASVQELGRRIRAFAEMGPSP